jgi:hypothetical protein
LSQKDVQYAKDVKKLAYLKQFSALVAEHNRFYAALDVIVWLQQVNKTNK